MRLYNQETIPMSPDLSLRGDLGLGTRLYSASLTGQPLHKEEGSSHCGFVSVCQEFLGMLTTHDVHRHTYNTTSPRRASTSALRLVRAMLCTVYMYATTAGSPYIYRNCMVCTVRMEDDNNIMRRPCPRTESMLSLCILY